MTLAQLKKKTHNDFESAISLLQEEGQNITARDTLIDFVKDNKDSNNIFIALHILEAIKDDFSDYYLYDYSMGTLDTPAPITCFEDLRDYGLC